jgi:hypothetical protein
MARFVPHRPGPAGVRHPAVDRYWTPTTFDDVVSASVPLAGTATEAATRSDSPAGTFPGTGTLTREQDLHGRSLRLRRTHGDALRVGDPQRFTDRHGRAYGHVQRGRSAAATAPAARLPSAARRPRPRPTATARAAPPIFQGRAATPAAPPTPNREPLRSPAPQPSRRPTRTRRQARSPHRLDQRVVGPLVRRRSDRHGSGVWLEHGRAHRNRRTDRNRSAHRQPDRGAHVQRLGRGHDPAFGDRVRRPLRCRCAVRQRSGHRLASGLAQDPGRALRDRPAVRHARRVLHTAADHLHRHGERNRQPRRLARRYKNRPRQPGRADPDHPVRLASRSPATTSSAARSRSPAACCS